ncbi:MAG TPA: PilZ domain-containing protein [Chiayiivirga sp.]|nr:MAG: PilZ domain-containing protein [Gammaproteobacteria bacterium]HPA01760.1 PilZ domain-containing protein [Chiayiivirga sp.]
MSQEYRRAKRKQVADRIDVTDTLTEHVIGLIGNISESGMMLLANTELAEDALYQMSFQLTDAGGNRREVSLGTHQLWSEPAGRPGQFWVGFRFIDISPDDLAVLRIWIDLPGSQYV